MIKLSVVMPVYNGEKYISQAIESILNQTYTDFEFIIVNDCSTDNTEQMIKQYSDTRIKLLSNEKNSGVAKSLNNALAVCQGEYIARMDADDISLPDRFKKQIEYLDENERVGVVACNTMTFCEEKVIYERGWSNTEPDKIKVDLLFACAIAHPSVMMRKSVLESVGAYNEEFNGIEDYELWCRVSEKYGIACLRDVLFKYRVHDSQVSRNVSDDIKRKLLALKKRQLARLGAELTDDELDAFFKYSLGATKRDSGAVKLLDSAFYKISSANRITREYDQKTLDGIFKGIIVTGAEALGNKEAKRIISQSHLIKSRDHLAYKIKKTIKALLKRG